MTQDRILILFALALTAVIALVTYGIYDLLDRQEVACGIALYTTQCHLALLGGADLQEAQAAGESAITAS